MKPERIYVSEQDMSAMLHFLGYADLSFGANKTWLKPDSPRFDEMHRFVLRLEAARQRIAISRIAYHPKSKRFSK